MIGTEVAVPLVPDAATFNRAAAWRAAENAVHGGYGAAAGDRLDGHIVVEGQFGYLTDALGVLDIGAYEFDTVGIHCRVPSQVSP